MHVTAEHAPDRRAEVGRLLYGLEAIGGYLGMTARQVEHQIGASGLPVIRLSRRRLAARPERLDAWLDGLERSGRSDVA